MSTLSPDPVPPTPFPLTGTLPTGRVAIEASAGTGKTFTLASLVLRYVAEAAVPIGAMVVVTFTRAAAAELRDRIRSRLAGAARALTYDDTDVVTEPNREPPPPDDELTAHLASIDRTVRLARIEQALADFDEAVITTIHGFAQQVLSTLGTAAVGDPDATLVADTSDVTAAACADILACEAVTQPERAAQLMKLHELTELVGTVLENPGIAIAPTASETNSFPIADEHRRLVEAAVTEVRRRRHLSGTRSFDDLLTQLRDALIENPGALDALRRHFPIALIDECQDTDPLQWQILSTLFGANADDATKSTARAEAAGDADPTDVAGLVLVADPKQAIYAFRGANVHTYLAAAGQPGTQRYTLQTNWRSDQALLDALARLFDGATFGNAQIRYIPVTAPPDLRERRLCHASGSPLPALCLRTVTADGLARTRAGLVVTGAAQAAIRDDLVCHVHNLLNTARIPTDPASASTRPVTPKDIAVLVGTNDEAGPIQQALRNGAIPAVTARGRSVLASEAARQWRWLLTALVRPADPSRARTAMLSWFFGWTLTQLAHVDPSDLAQVQDQLARWSEHLATDGVTEFCARLWHDSAVVPRLLGSADGDRNLTDLDHIAGLLQTHYGSRQQATAAGLLHALDQLADVQVADLDDDATARRVESGDEAVQIMTVHAAKGLEFPIVCLPSLWRARRSSSTVVYQDPATGRRTIDVAPNERWPNGSEARGRLDLARSEALGESLRLAYVALTRAAHQCVLWWAPTQHADQSGLARLLFARTDDGAIDPDLWSAPRVPLPPDTEVPALLDRILAPGDGTVDVAVTGPGSGGCVPRLANRFEPPPEPLRAAELIREVDRSTLRWSFSTISGHIHVGALNPADASLGDAGGADESTAEATDDLASGPSPWPTEHFTSTNQSQRTGDGQAAPTSDIPLGTIAGGAELGTLVHEVLQAADTTAADLGAELRGHVVDRLRWHPWPVAPDTLVAGLEAVVRSPLGPLFAGRRLVDLDRHHSIREVSFDLRLADGGPPCTDREIGEVVRRHLPASDPLRPWAEHLADGLFSISLAGHLTGSIDAVFRVADPSEPNRPAHFVVVDYKTNVLAEPGALPQLQDYHPDRLPAAMVHHHYPLQALLYAVALHRYLRWRLPGYQPAVHLGGAAYLFLRGMAGPTTPLVDGHPHGVFSWPIPHPLVTELSDLLHGRRAQP